MLVIRSVKHIILYSVFDEAHVITPFELFYMWTLIYLLTKTIPQFDSMHSSAKTSPSSFKVTNIP